MSEHTGEGQIISVQIADGAKGLLYATSEDLPGLFVAAEDMRSLKEEIPSVIKAMLEAEGLTVEVLPARRKRETRESKRQFPWVAIPAAAAHA
jgi:hypothetical protein